MPTNVPSLRRSPWLHSALFDTTFLLSPPLIVSLAACLFQTTFARTAVLPFWVWLVVLVGIDAGHIQSTVFRTYLNAKEFRERKRLFITVPLVIWGSGVLLYYYGEHLFWTVFAYAAVFHFIRQYYGFMMLYAHKEREERKRWVFVDKGVIYLAAIYPMVWWHTHLPRAFFWFFDYTFISGLPKLLEPLVLFLYLAFGVTYVIKETVFYHRYRDTSIPKQGVLIGTALCWYVGIVAFNNGTTFVLTSCVGHGVPYIGLIWLHGRKQAEPSRVFSVHFLPLFLGFIFLAACLQHGLWDALLWRAHPFLSRPFLWLPQLVNRSILTLIVPLISVPVLTHYILDGFIWRLRERNSLWRKALFSTDTREAPFRPSRQLGLRECH